MASQFQQAITNLKFQTCNHNQAHLLGYDDLFSQRRVLVFSITQKSRPSLRQLEKFDRSFPGIDMVLAVNSNNILFAPLVEATTKTVIGLFDSTGLFVYHLAQHYEYARDLNSLKNLWQFMAIIDNGEPKKIWHNPFKEQIPLRWLKDETLQYRKLEPEFVIDYLEKIKYYNIEPV